MHTAKQKIRHLGEFFQNFKWYSLDDFHRYKKSMALNNGKKTRCITLMLPWPTYDRRGIRAQENSDSWCGVLNSDRNQIKSRSLHKRKQPLSKHAFLKLWVPQRCIYLENASKYTSVKMFHLYVRLRIKIRTV